MKNILYFLPIVLILLYKFFSSSSQTSPSFIQLTGKIKDGILEYRQLDDLNEELLPHLHQLLHTDFFRFFKMNLKRECPFWTDDGKCLMEGCSVETTEDEKVRQMWKDQDLGALSASSFVFKSPFKDCTTKNTDFCPLEDDSQGVYIDLLKNPERYTGYSGESSLKVWQSIYEQNCFKFVFGQRVSLVTNLLPIDDLCIEKRSFYRVMSGMHSSISTHLCQEWLNKTTGQWVSNYDCFMERVGRYPERMDNLYFLNLLLLQSVYKLSPYLKQYSFCTPSEHDVISETMNQILEMISKNAPYFNTEVWFQQSELKDAFRLQFQNISRIMDCVGCEKCRLWGKIQTNGVGVAFKILFGYNDLAIQGRGIQPFQLRRAEVLTLFWAMTRFMESIDGLHRFRLQQEKKTNWLSWLYR